MKCPILHPDGEHTEMAIVAVAKDCLQAECAWWMNGDGICAVPAVAANLNTIANALDSINEQPAGRRG